MEQSSTKKLPFSKIHHIGFVIKDMDSMIENLASIGIGPFQPLGLPPLKEKRFRRKVTDWKISITSTRIGDLEFELLQPVEGDSPQKEFLEKTGGGFHHIGFVVDDLEDEVSKLVQQGARILSSGRREDGTGFDYLEFDTLPGIIIELMRYR